MSAQLAVRIVVLSVLGTKSACHEEHSARIALVISVYYADKYVKLLWRVSLTQINCVMRTLQSAYLPGY
eukprot:1023416-Pleurochrysis_carterae.AAC.1